MTLTKQQIDTLIYALYELKASEHSPSTKLHMEIYSMDADTLNANIDVLDAQLRELQSSIHKNFLINPMFTQEDK